MKRKSPTFDQTHHVSKKPYILSQKPKNPSKKPCILSKKPRFAERAQQNLQKPVFTAETCIQSTVPLFAKQVCSLY